MRKKPDFKDIKSFEEFNRYYWYREELAQICKSLRLKHKGIKQELNHVIEQYFLGNKIKDVKTSILKSFNNNQDYNMITLNTPLLECGFSFNLKFREIFSSLTRISPFKFNANMATAWRKVKSENDLNFTIQDMLKVYYGESDYAMYDHSVCQWNQFLKDFYSDKFSEIYSNKLKVASILWKEVRDSRNKKKYSRKLLDEYHYRIKKYQNRC